MAFWPADSRENVQVASEHSGKKGKQARWEFPFVTTGSLTATSLVNKDGKFEWTHVLQNKGPSGLSREQHCPDPFSRVEGASKRGKYTDIPRHKGIRFVEMEELTREMPGGKREWEKGLNRSRADSS